MISNLNIFTYDKRRKEIFIPLADGYGRVNNTISVQNGGHGGCCYQDVWHRGRDMSKNTTPLEWPGAMPDVERIILMRYV